MLFLPVSFACFSVKREDLLNVCIPGCSVYVVNLLYNKNLPFIGSSNPSMDANPGMFCCTMCGKVHKDCPFFSQPWYSMSQEI